MTQNWWPRWMATMSLAVAASLVQLGCGGGGVGTGGTGSFASGPISGFGSVIVNGITFDNTGAVVEDGDGVRRQNADLRLGMRVEVESEAISGGQAKANRIRYDAALLGRVDAVDSVASTMTVLGQTVSVSTATVFDDAIVGRLGGLAAGQEVEVHGDFDAATTRYKATRVERRTTAPASYRVRGVVAQVDPVARTLRIGPTTFSYAGASSVPAKIEVGQFVRLTLGTSQVGGLWPVQSFSTAVREVGELDDASFKGLINVFDSINSFQVDGRRVTTSSSTVFQGIQPKLGDRVEVEGAVRGGVMQARKVEVRTDEQETQEGFELKGTVATINALAGTFTLTGQATTISTSRPDLVYQPSGAGFASLRVGKKVEVKGLLATDGVTLEATFIKVDD